MDEDRYGKNSGGLQKDNAGFVEAFKTNIGKE